MPASNEAESHRNQLSCTLLSPGRNILSSPQLQLPAHPAIWLGWGKAGKACVFMLSIWLNVWAIAKPRSQTLLSAEFLSWCQLDTSGKRAPQWGIPPCGHADGWSIFLTDDWCRSTGPLRLVHPGQLGLGCVSNSKAVRSHWAVLLRGYCFKHLLWVLALASLDNGLSLVCQMNTFFHWAVNSQNVNHNNRQHSKHCVLMSTSIIQ